MQHDQVAAIWMDAGVSTPVQRAFSARSTVAEMIEAMDPAKGPVAAVLMDRDGNEHELTADRLAHIRIKPGQSVLLYRQLADQGGNQNSKGAALFGLIIAVAALATAGAALAGSFAAGGLFTAGSISAKLLAGAISFAGALARSALTKPPASSDKSSLDDRRGPASVQGNVLAAGTAIPRVIGTRRVFPPLACQPLVERIGKDEYAEAVYVLAGPHQISDIKLGDTPIANEADIEYQVRQGFGDDTDNGLVNRYARTKAPQIELSAHALDPDSTTGNALENALLPERSLPRWHAFNAKLGDEFWLHLTAPEGLYDRSSTDAYTAVPLRLRMRKADGDAWINFPELHFSGKKAGEVRLSILIKRQGPREVIPGVPVNAGFVGAFKYVTGQPSPLSKAHVADAMFSSGGGSHALYRGNEAASSVARTALFEDRAEFSIDPAVYDAGEWKFEIKRGCSYEFGASVLPGYPTSGVTDLFWYKAGPTPPRALANITDRIYLLRFSSITNGQPILAKGLTVIAIRARGRQIDALSVKASGLVRDWDGAGWNTWTATSNPAPHFRDVLTGDLSADPLPAEILDNQGLVEWRAACAANSWTVDMVCEGGATTDVLDRIASCGYARPLYSEIWGVTRDYNRTSETPVQMFTQRNSAELTLSKAFARLPDGFRAVFRDTSNNDEEREIIIWREGREGAVNPRLEEIRYEGLANEAAVRARARFDLRQGVHRSAFFGFKAPAEAIRCRRGSLISLNHDMLSSWQASARIAAVENAGGMVTAIIADMDVPLANAAGLETVSDVLTITDMNLPGRRTGLQIRQANGQTTTHQAAAISAADFGQRARIALVTPVAVTLAEDGRPAIRPGNLFQIGPLGAIARRLIVADIQFDKDLVATLTCVPEAPELWS